VARRLEQAGVAAIGVHPRAASQFYGGRADHEITGRVVSAVQVPVMASGDLFSVAAARRVREDTGAAAVMVARGMLGDPWLVQRLLSGEDGPPPTVDMAVAELRALLEAAVADMGEHRAVRWMRKLVAWYLRAAGVHGPTATSLQRLEPAAELDGALAELAGRLEATVGLEQQVSSPDG
jgi:tRNA-dihydrouridine synthase B